MGQMVFFDLSQRYGGLDHKPDPLRLLAKLVPWEEFRPHLRAALVSGGYRRVASAHLSQAGRKPRDGVF
jgi:hypothetical protein